MKCEKEDLLWEALRRNEDFKNDLREYHDHLDVDGADEHKELFQSLHEKWGIDNIPESYEISSIEIRNKLANDEDFSDVHPYGEHFRLDNFPVKYHDLSNVSIDQNKQLGAPNEWKVRIKSFPWLRRFIYSTKNRLIVSIDPFASDTEVFSEITKIKMEVRKNIKTIMESDKKNRSYSPVRISSYIEWLETYDKFVKNLIELIGEEDLTINNGAYIKPNSIPYRKFVTHEDAMVKCREIIKVYLRSLLQHYFNKKHKIEIKVNTELRKPRNFKRNLKELHKSEIVKLLSDKVKLTEKNKIESYCLGSNAYDPFTEDEYNKYETIFDGLDIASSSLIREDLRKTFENQVKEAILLIQNVPNIKFGLTRVDKVTKSSDEE
jgi:hypothetical protein